MTAIIVLFNLKPGVSEADYEAWSRTTDIPVVRALPSIDRFDVVRTSALLGSDARPPYRYVEIIQVNDMTLFGSDVASETMQKVSGEFQQFAEAPLFMLADAL